MEQKGGSEQHGGILLRGADGTLWFMRDDDDEPKKVGPRVAERIHRLMQREPSGQQLGFPASEDIVEALADEYGALFPWGAIIWWGKPLSK